MKKSIKRRIVSTMMFLMLLSSQNVMAQGVKSKLSEVITSYAVPIFGAVMILSLFAGVAKNWRLINDENSEGNKKQGWLNIAYMIGYVLVAVIIIGIAGTAIAGMSVTF